MDLDLIATISQAILAVAVAIVAGVFSVFKFIDEKRRAEGDREREKDKTTYDRQRELLEWAKLCIAAMADAREKLRYNLIDLPLKAEICSKFSYLIDHGRYYFLNTPYGGPREHGKSGGWRPRILDEIVFYYDIFSSISIGEGNVKKSTLLKDLLDAQREFVVLTSSQLSSLREKVEDGIPLGVEQRVQKHFPEFRR